MAYSDPIADTHIAEFLDLARSANVSFTIDHDRLAMRMVNPIWSMWSPIRHLLDEIGTERIEAYLRREAELRVTVDEWNHASAERLHLAAEAMRG